MKTFTTTQPIYMQIMDDIKTGICSGRLGPGEKLPSVRDFALQQGVNPNTVQKAFSQLEQEQLLFSNRTNGRFVTEDKELIKKMKDVLAKTYIAEFLQKMQEIGYQQEEILSLLTKHKKEDDCRVCN